MGVGSLVVEMAVLLEEVGDESRVAGLRLRAGTPEEVAQIGEEEVLAGVLLGTGALPAVDDGREVQGHTRRKEPSVKSTATCTPEVRGSARLTRPRGSGNASIASAGVAIAMQRAIPPGPVGGGPWFHGQRTLVLAPRRGRAPPWVAVDPELAGRVSQAEKPPGKGRINAATAAFSMVTTASSDVMAATKEVAIASSTAVTATSMAVTASSVAMYCHLDGGHCHLGGGVLPPR
jgi:hypothetical protein